MDKPILPKLDLSNLNYIPSLQRSIPQMEMPEFTNFVQEHQEEEKVYWEQTLNLLNDIKDNTANLSTIVRLIAESNANQQQVIDIISEFLNIATIKDNPEQAKSLYRQVMDKVHSISSDIETVNKLLGFGMMIGQALHSSGIM